MNSLTQQPAIIFDLGGVLIQWERRYVFEDLLPYNGVEMDTLLNEICTLEWNAEMDAGKPFAQAVAERIALYPKYASFIRAYHEQWPKMIRGSIDDTVQIMSELRQAGYELHALSNWSAETFPLVQPRFPFLGWFDITVLSGEMGVNKPDARIYETLLQRIQRPANECLFIDDTAKNITAAHQLGFDVVHFQSPQQLRQALQQRQLL